MIDKEALLKSSLRESEVEIPGRGTVRVRSLSRLERLRLNDLTHEEAEVVALSCGLVEPTLDLDEARAVLEGTEPGELQPVISEILRLSGLLEGAQKSDGTGADDR